MWDSLPGVVQLGAYLVALYVVGSGLIGLMCLLVLFVCWLFGRD